MFKFFKILFYFIGFAAMSIVAALLFYEMIGFDRSVDVPMLIGKSISEVEELLEGKDLSLTVGGETFDPEIPEGSISRQDKKPGERVARGSEIKVFISSSAEVLSMPSFEGQRLEDAKLTLINLGMELKKVTGVHSDTVDEGKIIAQRPLPGNTGGNQVNFIVSKGRYDVSYKCPSFINMSVEDSRDLANTLGLRLIEKKAGGRVIFQKPEAGTVMKRGDPVEVTLGRGWGLWF